MDPLPPAGVALNAAIALALQLMGEEERDYNRLMLAAAEIMVQEIMDIEEDGVWEAYWIPVTVDINEFHNFSDHCFRMHFRMSKRVFAALVEAIGDNLVQRDKLVRERTPLQDIVLMVLWLIATPDSFRSVSLKFGVCPSTLYIFYIHVIEALRHMASDYIRWPNEEERVVIKETFEGVSGFPGIVGCVDGTHVYITAPVEDAVQYQNRYQTYSMNVQAIVDNNLLVHHLHIGEEGSMHDWRVFRKSSIYEDVLMRRDDLMAPDEHLVGDGAYTLTDFMMIPFENNGHLTDEQFNFNRRLSQCRVRVENAFGRAKSKWRRLKFLHATNPLNVVDHITASFVLHNFTVINGEPLFEDEAPLEVPINNNQVLGAENFNNEDFDEDALLNEVHGLGIEKRTFIMQDVLPPP